ncbi:MAG: hypothetical protein WBP12_04380 [Candidatus Saccharimonas sp.]
MKRVQLVVDHVRVHGDTGVERQRHRAKGREGHRSECRRNGTDTFGAIAPRQHDPSREGKDRQGEQGDDEQGTDHGFLPEARRDPNSFILYSTSY